MEPIIHRVADRFAAEGKDPRAAVDAVIKLIQDGAEDEAIKKALNKLRTTDPTFRIAPKDVQWFLSTPAYRTRLVSHLEQLYAQWAKLKAMSESAQEVLPKAKELVEHLLAVKSLQKKLVNAKGAFYFRHELAKLQVGDLLTVLQTFVTDHDSESA